MEIGDIFNLKERFSGLAAEEAAQGPAGREADGVHPRAGGGGGAAVDHATRRTATNAHHCIYTRIAWLAGLRRHGYQD